MQFSLQEFSWATMELKARSFFFKKSFSESSVETRWSFDGTRGLLGEKTF